MAGSRESYAAVAVKPGDSSTSSLLFFGLGPLTIEVEEEVVELMEEEDDVETEVELLLEEVTVDIDVGEVDIVEDIEVIEEVDVVVTGEVVVVVFIVAA